MQPNDITQHHQTPNYSTRPVPGGASRRQTINIVSKLSSVAEAVQVCIRLMDQQQLNWSRTTMTLCSATL